MHFKFNNHPCVEAVRSQAGGHAREEDGVL